MRVLVIEDDAAIRHILDILLTRLGHSVLTAKDANHATALLMDFPDAPAVGIVDLVLPGMSGVEYADRLSECYPDTRFVFITGWPDHPTVAAARDRGLVVFKPFSPQDMLAAIATAAG